MRELAPLHPVSRVHLDELTDHVGIMQHAIGSRPDPAHGYCTDDVARALQVDLLHGRVIGWPTVADRASRNLDFLAEGFAGTTGRFWNFRSVDGTWVDGVGSEDCHGRAMLALGELIGASPDAHMIECATSLFDRALPAALELTALRARASVVLGCSARLRAVPDAATEAACRALAFPLLALFEAQASSAWAWPEAIVTYENGVLPRALIVAGQTLGSQTMIDVGLNALDWLIDAQTSSDDRLSPIGNGWWVRDGEKSRFDQQPIEATAMLLAAEAAYQVTADPTYLAAMERAYAWFLGGNDLCIDVADPTTGAGYDGLTPEGVNTNQGAESTLMWLMAAEHIRTVRARESAGYVGRGSVGPETRLAVSTA